MLAQLMLYVGLMMSDTAMSAPAPAQRDRFRVMFVAECAVVVTNECRATPDERVTMRSYCQANATGREPPAPDPEWSSEVAAKALSLAAKTEGGFLGGLLCYKNHLARQTPQK